MKIIFIISSAIFLCSCVPDTNPKLFNMLNNSNKELIICTSNDSLYQDSDLYYGTKIYIKANKVNDYHGVPLGNSFFIFIFDKDTVDLYQRNNTLQGISQKSILGSYFLLKDTLNKNDTLKFDDMKHITLIHYLTKN